MQNIGAIILTADNTNEASPKPKNLSPMEKKKKSKTDYDAYVLSLESSGKKFPINQDGNPNYTAIAEACGFGRQVLYKTLAADLARDIRSIGTEIYEGVSNEDRLSKQSTQNKKNASKLQKLLDATVQEVVQLRKDNLALEKDLAIFEAKESESSDLHKEMIDNGRVFKL
jgi:hypothetical protein